MDFSLDFFRDEVRNEFFIPGAVKQAWASALCVLDAIDKICEKNQITYFADWGTILGAVRHGGIVPWDDDIDICMKRNDYNKFKKIAAKELPEGFCVHDYMSRDNHWLFLSRVVNNKQICFEPEHLMKFYNFPYIASVDIFVVDCLYDDENEEKSRCEEVKAIISLADYIVQGKPDKKLRETELARIECRYKFKINRHFDNITIGKELYRLAEMQMGRVLPEQSHRLGQIFPWGLLGDRGMDKDFYEKLVRLPFENTTIPVPANYHKLLSKKYGRYMLPEKKWNGHNYPFFEGQRANLQAAADFKLPEFTFEKNMLRNNCPYDESRETVQKNVSGALNDLTVLHKQYGELVKGGRASEGQELLPQCQNVALDVGNYIEETWVKYYSKAYVCINALETYCEALFQLFNYMEENSDFTELPAGDSRFTALYDNLKNQFEIVKDLIYANIIKCRLVLFLPDNPQNWHEMNELYQYYKAMEDVEVCVIPLPVFSKSPYGQIKEKDEELEANAKIHEYPQELSAIFWDSIDISMYEFEAIIVQNQYDGENGYLTVPDIYYSSKLRNYTKRLIYLMKEGIGDFKCDDKADMYGLRYRLRVPAAMYADKIMIVSEKMKPLYVDYLVQFAGEETRKNWEDKFAVKERFIRKFRTDKCQSDEWRKDKQKTNNSHNKRGKAVLFCVGENRFASDENEKLNKLRKDIDTLKSFTDIDVYVYTYPASVREWQIADSAVRQNIEKLLSGFKSYNKILPDRQSRTESAVEGINAYYGSPSPLVLSFVEQKKPVMISQD